MYSGLGEKVGSSGAGTGVSGEEEEEEDDTSEAMKEVGFGEKGGGALEKKGVYSVQLEK